MNKLDATIVLIENAKELVDDADHYYRVNWTGYQDNLRIARRLLSEMYVHKDGWNSEAEKKHLTSCEV
ncbi:MAG: hypothetical protein ACLSH6_01345 [Limosilactobacillus pontis]